MLDRSRLLQELERKANDIFIDQSEAYSEILSLWKRASKDPVLLLKSKSAMVSWPMPTWDDAIDRIYFVTTNQNNYTIFSVDGSQIYPDRHFGVSCYLINTGEIVIRYGDTQNPVSFHTEPHVFTRDDLQEHLELSTELINCKRQELELQRGVVRALKLQKEGDAPLLLLFDGSLIFWHLEAKDSLFKELFLSRYLLSLMQLYKAKILNASYISMPKSREIINLLRAYACDFNEKNEAEMPAFARMPDTVLLQHLLKKGERTIVFKNHSRICENYPDPVHPYFFYLHVGDEIGRVEIPAWIARDEKLTNRVAELIFDQSIKGHGYPIAIAEAHEQAVVKGPDREFFYHLLTRMGMERKKQVLSSQKAMQKRGMAT